MATKKAVARRKSAGLPANIEEQLKQMATQQADATSATGRKVKLKHTGFEFPGGHHADSPMRVVILAVLSRNAYYDTPYVAGQVSPPACIAQGFAANDNLVPHPDSPTPQNTDCRTCPQNQYGTANGGTGKGKACSNRKLLAILPPGADDNDEIFVVDAPPTANGRIDAFVSGLQTRYGLPTLSFTAELEIVEAGSSVSITLGHEEPNADVHSHLTRYAEAQKLLDTLPQMTKAEDEAPKPKRVTRKKAARR
jgi:hypothetical protein